MSNKIVYIKRAFSYRKLCFTTNKIYEVSEVSFSEFVWVCNDFGILMLIYKDEYMWLEEYKNKLIQERFEQK